MAKSPHVLNTNSLGSLLAAEHFSGLSYQPISEKLSSQEITNGRQ